MSPEQRRLRQTSALMRLRKVQAQMAVAEFFGRSMDLQRVERRADEHRERYQDQLQKYHKLQAVGLVLDPQLHEARLQCLQSLHTEASNINGELQKAEKRLGEAKAALSSAHVNEHLALRALESSRQAVAEIRAHQERLNMLDAQIAGIDRHGV